MASYISGNDLWPRNGSLSQLLPERSGGRRGRDDALGEGTGRDAVGLRAPVGQAVAIRSDSHQEDGRAMGALDAAGDALLLLSGKIGRSEAVGQAARGDSCSLRAVRGLQQSTAWA